MSVLVARPHLLQTHPARAIRTICPEPEALIAGLIDIDPEARFHGATSLVSMSRSATRTWPVISWCRVVWNRASRAARLARWWASLRSMMARAAAMSRCSLRFFDTGSSMAENCDLLRIGTGLGAARRSEEHTSELQSLMR